MAEQSCTACSPGSGSPGFATTCTSCSEYRKCCSLIKDPNFYSHNKCASGAINTNAPRAFRPNRDRSEIEIGTIKKVAQIKCNSTNPIIKSYRCNTNHSLCKNNKLPVKGASVPRALENYFGRTVNV